MAPISSKTLRLRALEPSDLEFLYLAENDPTSWGHGTLMAPISRHTLRQFIETSFQPIEESRQIRLIAAHSPQGDAIGIVDLFDISMLHRHASLGILVYPPSERGKGNAKQMLCLAEEYAREHLGLAQLYAEIRADNAASLQLFAQSGFETIGIKKAWLRTPAGRIDVHCLQHSLC